MNFKESKQILKKIKNSNRILLMCHTSPDPDSIISCIVMKRILSKFRISSDIYSRDKIHETFRDLDTRNEIITMNPHRIDFDKYDVFFTLDASGLTRYGIDFKLPAKLQIINIDHHDSIEPADLQIKGTGLSSTSEMLFHLSSDFGIELNKEELNLVLVAMITDTGTFQYNATSQTFETVAKLINLGVNYDKAAIYSLRNNTLDQIKFTASMLSKIKVDKKYSFAYMAMPYEEFSKYKNLLQPNRKIADYFARTVMGTEFGIAMLESQKNVLKVSIRTRMRSYSLLPILEELGGGGYKDGGGADVKNMSFDKAVKKVLEVARKYAETQK